MTVTRRTSDFFDSYAHDFDAIYGNKNTPFNRVVNHLFRKSMRLRYAKTIEGCYPVEGKRVIDIGCGPGHFGIALARKGASYVRGLDFAEGMINIARSNAKAAGVDKVCDFMLGDFMKDPIPGRFDYAIVMGVMDYISEPEKAVEKVLSITGSKAFFSFPVDGGMLAWQRKLRYKKRCELYMYTRERLHALFSSAGCGSFEVEKISRDFFVTAVPK
ncbi:MAG: methyltransferase domain-containing protein [Nitrospirae bacterium]|nr:methyltransferase domain-containing protein [Nitrospirota bacterium]